MKIQAKTHPSSGNEEEMCLNQQQGNVANMNNDQTSQDNREVPGNQISDQVQPQRDQIPVPQNQQNRNCQELCGKLLRVMGDFELYRVCGGQLRDMGDDLFNERLARNLMTMLQEEMVRNESLVAD